MQMDSAWVFNIAVASFFFLKRSLIFLKAFATDWLSVEEGGLHSKVEIVG